MKVGELCDTVNWDTTVAILDEGFNLLMRFTKRRATYFSVLKHLWNREVDYIEAEYENKIVVKLKEIENDS